MKKIIELIRTKEREEKAIPNNKKASLKEEKPSIQVQAPGQSVDNANDLFWDDYSDVGYC